MIKRICVFVAAVLLVMSLNASAWAASYAIEGITLEYLKFYDVDNRASEDVVIRIRTKVNGLEDASTLGSSNAVYLRLKVEGYESKMTDVVLTGNSATQMYNDHVRFTLDSSRGIKNYDAKLTGKLAASGDITVTATLRDASLNNATKGDNANENSISQTKTITLSEEEGIDKRSDAFGKEPYSVPTSTSELDDTAADPSSSNWDGKDPVFGTGDQGDSKTKPKIATSKLTFYDSNSKTLTSGRATTFQIEIDGPTPKVDVYIAAKDAKKLWPLSCDKKYAGSDWTSNISLTQANILKWKLPFRVTSYDIKTSANQNKLTKHYITIAYNGAHVSYKGFPLTVAASNQGTIKNNTDKPVTKTYKIDITSSRTTPQWVTSDGVLGEKLTNPDTGKASKNADTIPVRLDYSGREVFTTSYTVSCDPPYRIEAKGSKDGVTATVYQPVLNRYGEVTTPGYVVIGGSFDKAKVEDKDGNSKEAKVSVTLNAAASAKKTNFKTTVTGKVSPYFPSNKIVSQDGAYYLKGVKRVEAGKVPSVKFSAKGSKTITYSLTDGADELAAHGLSFDAKKGAVIALGDKKNISSTISGDSFQSIDIAVTANNGTGKKTTLRAEIGITGAKPKFATKTLTISRDALTGLSDDTVLTDYPIELQNASGDHLIYTFADTKSSTDLKAVGLGLDSSGRLKVVSSKDIKATKSTKISVNADNYGAVAKGSINVVIVDPAPEISADTTATFANASKDATATVTLKLKEDPTDGAKIQWTLKTKPTASDVTATLKAAADGKTATLTLKLKKNVTAGGQYTAGITAKNPNSKLTSTEHTIKITAGTASTTTQTAYRKVGAAVVGDTGASAPESGSESEPETEEQTLTFGPSRTVSSLTASQNALLQREGLTVIAVLPEVSANVEGQADMAVELYPDAPVGARLVWLPFPKDVEETDDDRIADFYDEDGAPIENVPEGREITVSAWMRPGVTYQPVIAAEK